MLHVSILSVGLLLLLLLDWDRHVLDVVGIFEHVGNALKAELTRINAESDRQFLLESLDEDLVLGVIDNTFELSLVVLIEFRRSDSVEFVRIPGVVGISFV